MKLVFISTVIAPTALGSSERAATAIAMSRERHDHAAVRGAEAVEELGEEFHLEHGAPPALLGEAHPEVAREGNLAAERSGDFHRPRPL